MDDLCPRRVWGFSTGCILAPRRWTLDVVSHHLPSHAYSSGAAAATRTTSPHSADSDALPIGSSSNTARLESMDGSGATLYVMELFVPTDSVDDDGGVSGAATPSWTAERLRSSLLRGSLSSVASTEIGASHGDGDGVEREAAPLHAWAAEVVPLPPPPSAGSRSNADDAPPAKAAVPCCTIVAGLRPLFRVFVAVVWDGGVAAPVSAEALDGTAHRIMSHLQQLYNTPAVELDAFRCFVANAAVTVEAPVGGAVRVLPSSANGTAPSPTAVQLREPCAPHVLADMGSDGLSSVWGVCMHSAAGAALLQLRVSEPSAPDITAASLSHQGRTGDARGSVSRRRVCVYPSPSAHSVTRGTAAAALQRLLQRDLQLCWEGLTVTTSVAAAEAVVAVAALPLGGSDAAAQSSIYSFPSVERAWEAQVTRSLRRLCDGGGSDAAPGAVRQWDLRRLSTTPRPTLEQLDAALCRAERQQLEAEDRSLSAAERSMCFIARDAGESLTTPRCTSYALRVCRGPSVRTAPVGDAAAGDGSSPSPVGGASAVEVYVLRLHAPRALCRGAAVVVCTAVCDSLWGPLTAAEEMGTPPTLSGSAASDGEGCGAVAADRCDALVAAAAALGAAYTTAPHAPSVWLPREAAVRGGSGVCARSGRLLLHVPSCDARYRGLRLAPVASNTFTTLGSIAAWSSPHALPSPEEHPALSATDGAAADVTQMHASVRGAAALAHVSAVWTLIGDGRSAAAYLDDAVREFTYDTGARTLHNVGQPSQHERRAGVLVVRRRERRRANAGGSATTKPSSLVSAQEVCSAWLDVGTTLRLFLCVRDVGVGEVLLVEGSIAGPHTEVAGRDAVEAAAEAVSRAEEALLEAWVDGLTAAAVVAQR